MAGKWDMDYQLHGVDDEAQEILTKFWLSCRLHADGLSEEAADMFADWCWGEQRNREVEVTDPDEIERIYLRGVRWILTVAGSVAFVVRIRGGDPNPGERPPRVVDGRDKYEFQGGLIFDGNTMEQVPMDDIPPEERRLYYEAVTAMRVVVGAMNWDADAQMEALENHARLHGPRSVMSINVDLMRMFLEYDGLALLSGHDE